MSAAGKPARWPTIPPLLMAALLSLLAAWDGHAGKTEEVFAETGLAIVISILTSVTAFAAFLFSRSPSLVFFGSQAAYALIGCLVVTLVVLPFLFRVLLPSRASVQEHNRA